MGQKMKNKERDVAILGIGLKGLGGRGKDWDLGVKGV